VERELLVLLLRIADAATKRKEALLEETELAVSLIDEDSSLMSSRRFMDHYSWLETNLEETNKTLSMALQYIRMMYGKAYLPSRASEQPKVVDFVENALTNLLSRDAPLPEAAHDWAAQVAFEAEDLSDRLNALVEEQESDKKKAEPSAEVKYRLNAVGQLVFSASIGQGLAAASSDLDHLPSTAALVPATAKLLSLPEMPTASTDVVVDDLYMEVKNARDDAVADLKEAMNLFQTELALGSLAVS